MAKMNLGRVVGRSAYEEAVLWGYEGDEESWLETLKGANAYQIAVNNGYKGSETDWLNSFHGKSAYQNAVDGGFVGSELDFNTSLGSIGNINAVLDAINGGESV